MNTVDDIPKGHLAPCFRSCRNKLDSDLWHATLYPEWLSFRRWHCRGLRFESAQRPVRVLENKPARAMRSPYKIIVCELLLLRHDVLSVERMNVGSYKGRVG